MSELSWKLAGAKLAYEACTRQHRQSLFLKYLPSSKYFFSFSKITSSVFVKIELHFISETPCSAGVLDIDCIKHYSNTKLIALIIHII